jgi:hypothetical protein
MIPNITLIKFEDLNVIDLILIIQNIAFEYQIDNNVFLGLYAKLLKMDSFIHNCPRGTTRLPPDGLS